MPIHPKAEDLRLRQGAIFLGGALAYLLLVEGPLDFDFTPLLLGLIYLLAASAGGRDGGFWPTASVLTGWGLGVVAVREVEVEVSEAAAMLTGAGAGVLVAALLARAGYEADQLGSGATAMAAGLLYALQPHVDVVLEPALYVIGLGLLGAVNVLLAVGPRRDGERPPFLS